MHEIQYEQRGGGEEGRGGRQAVIICLQMCVRVRVRH